MGEDAQKKALEIMPALAQMIQPGNFEIFAITDGNAVISDLLSSETETIEIGCKYSNRVWIYASV